MSISAAISARKGLTLLSQISLRPLPHCNGLRVRVVHWCVCICERASQSHTPFHRWIALPSHDQRQELNVESADVDAWKVRCNPRSKDFCKRTITDHLCNQHEASKVMVRGWHIRKDATAAKRGDNFSNWSRFQLAWERKRNSMQALALADGPAPPPPALGAAAAAR